MKKRNNTKLPEAIKEKALETVQAFNSANNTKYEIKFRSHFLYLARLDKSGITKIGRLKYLPEQNKWDFAVFKYSNEKYDPDEWMFPGQNLLDGSIEGALKAGMEIYPPSAGLGCSPIGCLLAIFIIPIQIIVNLVRKIFKR